MWHMSNIDSRAKDAFEMTHELHPAETAKLFN